MNPHALIEYISKKLHTVVYQIDSSGSILSSYCGIPDFTDSIITMVSLSDYVNQCIENSIPIIFSLGTLCYTLLYPFTEQDGYLIGPVKLSSPISLYLKQDLPIKPDKEWMEQISIVPFDELIDIAQLVHNLFSEKSISKNEIQMHNLAQRDIQMALQKRYTNLLFENHENTIHHNPYSQEFREQASIENGDLEALERATSEDYTGQLGTLSKDHTRNMKNLGIVLVTLASRSAIRGGLAPEIAFSLSDSYIQQIEDMDTVSNIRYFVYQMEYHYASLVKEIREQNKKKNKKNPHIEKCKDYIFSHLHDRITNDVLADELGYNPDYLSHLFKTSEGIGISQYIIREKINRSQNLLIYTHYTYSEIATYLGFSSQSHFTKHFKKYTGMTPHQFRISQQVEDFFHST